MMETEIWLVGVGLILYLLIGAVFALSILSSLFHRMPVRLRQDVERDKFIVWMTNIIVFLRWSCGWLPIVIYYRWKAR
jgi:hypothetical protein